MSENIDKYGNEIGIDGKCVVCGLLTKDILNGLYMCPRHMTHREFFLGFMTKEEYRDYRKIHGRPPIKGAKARGISPFARKVKKALELMN